MSSRATPVALKRFKPLYKGRRYWVFENDESDPYEGWTEEWKILVYHRHYDSIVACGNWSEGEIKAETCWGQGISFQADGYADMAAHVGWLEKEYFD